MSKTYLQHAPVVWETATTMLASASVAGSALCAGYARITGLLISSASADSGSGLRVWQSTDYGTHWDYWTDYAPSACSGSGFSIELIGNAVKVQFKPDSEADEVRSCWRLRPI